jgi:hypothetical protein
MIGRFKDAYSPDFIEFGSDLEGELRVSFYDDRDNEYYGADGQGGNYTHDTIPKIIECLYQMLTDSEKQTLIKKLGEK